MFFIDSYPKYLFLIYAYRAEYLEGVFVRSPFVGQIFVYGDSMNSFLVAVIVPDFEVLDNYAAEIGIPVCLSPPFSFLFYSFIFWN